MFSLFLWSLCLKCGRVFVRGAATEAHHPVFNCSIKAQFNSARSLLISFCAHLLSTQLFDFRVFKVKNTKKSNLFPLSLNEKDCNFKFFCNFLGSHLNMEIACNQNYICFPGKREKAALSAHSTWDYPAVMPISLCVLKPFASYSPSNGKIFLLF